MNPKVLESKKQVVSEINELLERSNCAIVVGYKGLTVDAITALRRSLKKVNAQMEVFKNTLLRIAVDSSSYKDLDSSLKGQNALITSVDSTAALGVISQFAKKNKSFEIKGAVIEKAFCPIEKLEALASVNGKEGALSMLLSVLEAPIRQFAVACKAVGEQKPAA